MNQELFNIKQITNDDIKNGTRLRRSISVPSFNEKTGRVETVLTSKDYIDATGEIEAIKMGYSCEPKGIIYPIYIKTYGNNYYPFQVNKNGIYEVQTEQTINKYGEDVYTNIPIRGVLVPADIDFVLDYIVSIG